MPIDYYDIIIVGTGISGLYSALKIKETSPNTSFVLLEKYKKQWIGGRTSNDCFYGTEIVNGAGIGRKHKDKLLFKLLDKLNISTTEFKFKPNYSELIQPIDIKKIMNTLRSRYNEYKNQNLTFKQYSTIILGEKLYKQLIISSGFSDYENEDALETLYYYGMDDNYCCWNAFKVPWKKMVIKMYNKIGESHFKFSNGVTEIRKIRHDPCKFVIFTDKQTKFLCNRVIIATTIDTTKKLLPQYPIYNDIEGQPFLRLYGKFSKESIPIIKEYVKNITFLPGPLQKIIPMDPDKGIYMISYSDNNNAVILKNHLDNTSLNRKLYCLLIEKSLGIPKNSLQLNAIKDYYWPIGTHYFKPLNKNLYKSREEFIYKAQRPERGILVVGEAVSRNQGWSEGALESVNDSLTKKWIKEIC